MERQDINFLVTTDPDQDRPPRATRLQYLRPTSIPSPTTPEFRDLNSGEKVVTACLLEVGVQVTRSSYSMVLTESESYAEMFRHFPEPDGVLLLCKGR